ncbi:MAG: hypothetical protein WC528_01965 [Patescibacteria group bacterium]
MGIITRNAAFISSLLIFAVLEIIAARPQAVYLSLLILLFLSLAALLFSGRRIWHKDFWLCLQPALLFQASGLLLLYFLETNIFRQILIVFVFLLNWLFFKSYYQVKQLGQGPKILTGFLNALTLFTAFFCFLDFFALKIFLDLNIWLLTFLVVPVSFLLIWQNFRLEAAKNRFRPVYYLVILLILTEVFLGLTYFPTNFFVNGLFFTALFYLLFNISRLQIVGQLTKKILFSYLAFGIGLAIIVFSTAQWI